MNQWWKADGPVVTASQAEAPPLRVVLWGPPEKQMLPLPLPLPNYYNISQHHSRQLFSKIPWLKVKEKTTAIRECLPFFGTNTCRFTARIPLPWNPKLSLPFPWGNSSLLPKSILLLNLNAKLIYTPSQISVLMEFHFSSTSDLWCNFLEECGVQIVPNSLYY